MIWYVALLAALAGYLAGSVPFALVIVRWFGRGVKLQPTELKLPGSTDVLRSNAVSATAVRLQLGARFGCLTSLLDMAKAAAVTLAFRFAFPDAPYYLIASGFAVAGHIWPLFNHFRGGRGQSPAIGGLFIVDWPSPLVAYPIAMVLGLMTRSRAYISRFAPMLVAGAWLFWRFRDWTFAAYAVGLFSLRLIATRREIAQFVELRRAGHLRSLSEELQFLGMGHVASRLAGRIRRLRTLLRPHREP